MEVIFVQMGEDECKEEGVFFDHGGRLTSNPSFETTHLQSADV
jgi:hypothetical protein